MTGSAVKLIAIIAMLIDHIGAAFFPQNLFLRAIGRIAFPIFSYFIAEGFYYTKNRTKYLIRLSLFAFLSEIPFDLLFYNSILDFSHQNVFFTLALGLIAIWTIDHFKSKNIALTFCGYLIAIGIAFLAYFIKTDYDAYGIALIVLFYTYRSNKLTMSVVFTFFSTAYSLFIYQTPLLLFQLFSLIPLYLYNGKKGSSSTLVKYSFYLFYPAHLLLLIIIRLIISIA